MKTIIIAGQNILLTSLKKEDLKGVYIDAIVRFNFYRGELNDNPFILLEHKKSENLRPLQYKGSSIFSLILIFQKFLF